MIIDSFTIVICCILIVLALLSSLSDIFFRRVSVGESGGGEAERCPVSVVIISDNNAAELRENLPSFLSQSHSAGFEVIVVVAKDDDGTADVLNSFGHLPGLYVTHVPDSSRYMSRRKLAVTLGVKAAKNEWVLLTDATCRPLTDRWIDGMSSRCRQGIDMVVGYSNYADGTGHFKTFSRFRREYQFMYEALTGVAYAMAGCNLMFRKSVFMAGNGFRGNLKYLRGEYEFLVNKYAGRDNVAVSVEPGTFLAEAVPTAKGWHDRNVFYYETRRHLVHRMRHRALFNFDMLSLHAGFVLPLCAGCYAALFHNWLVMAFAVIALVVPLVVRTLHAGRAMSSFGLAIPRFKVVLFELRLVWHNLRYTIAYKTSDKYEFISHKS